MRAGRAVECFFRSEFKRSIELRNSKGIAWALMLVLGASGFMLLWRFVQDYGTYILVALGGLAVVACLPGLYRRARIVQTRVRAPQFKPIPGMPPADIRYVAASNLTGRLVPTRNRPSFQRRMIDELPTVASEPPRAVKPLFQRRMINELPTVASEPPRAVLASPTSKVVVGLWNVQWAARSNRKGKFFAPLLLGLDCDVLCITEGSADVLPERGHTIVCGADYGYGVEKSKRKVMLWSRNPWLDVDEVGSGSLPPGRFIAGTTDTGLGLVRFVGVCIPWRAAHVSSGQRNRSPWQDHLTYCSHLLEALATNTIVGTVLLGDFNQRIPCQGQPAHVYEALVNALGSRFKLTTAGAILGAPGPAIDHLAVTGGLHSAGVTFLSPEDEFGKAMSDHFGMKVTLTRAAR